MREIYYQYSWVRDACDRSQKCSGVAKWELVDKKKKTLLASHKFNPPITRKEAFKLNLIVLFEKKGKK